MSGRRNTPSTPLATSGIELTVHGGDDAQLVKQPPGTKRTPCLLISFLVLLLGSLAAVWVVVAARKTDSAELGYSYEWSGYGCGRQCDLGDNNYVLEARLGTYSMPGSGNNPNVEWTSDASMYTRTWVGTEGLGTMIHE